MAIERWGSLSVADHNGIAVLTANVLLYDRLVMPIYTEARDRNETQSHRGEINRAQPGTGGTYSQAENAGIKRRDLFWPPWRLALWAGRLLIRWWGGLLSVWQFVAFDAVSGIEVPNRLRPVAGFYDVEERMGAGLGILKRCSNLVSANDHKRIQSLLVLIQCWACTAEK